MTHRFRSLTLALSGGCALATVTCWSEKRPGRSPYPTLLSTVGHTPLLELPTLSKATGCTILAKCEHMNPGLSVKDRAAMNIVTHLERSGKLSPGVSLVEGTGGNTGVGLAVICAAKGYKLTLTMPDYVSSEKVKVCEALGATVILCPSVGVPFADPRHFYQVAKRMGEEPGYVWGNQFESLVNRDAHFKGTGPEIWGQVAAAGDSVDAFVVASGTGGTLAGVGGALKALNPSVKLYLIDPQGSSLASYVRTGVLAPSSGSPTLAKGTTLEGIGIGRLTTNFLSTPPLDGVFDGYDQEAVDMMVWLAKREGVFVGPSAALNVVGAVKAARLLGPGKTVVTVLCDSGARYVSKHFSPEWRAENSLVVSPTVYEGGDNLPFIS